MSSITLSLALRGRLLSGTQTTFQGALFGNSEPGFTFEPWDMTTLYQDRAGTTPVTAAGQSVGLRLDKSKGLALGVELVAPLISDALWVQMPATPNSSVSGNQLTFGGQFSGRRYAVNTTNPSSRYEFRFNARRVSGNASIFFFHEGSQSGTISPLTLTDTMSSYVIRPQGAAGGGLVSFGFQDRNASGFGTIEVTNISVRELAGTHEVAINDASRGIYGWMPKTGRRNKLTYTEQFDNAAWTKSVATVTANAAVAPDGTTTADLVAGGGFVRQQYAIAATAVRYTYSIYAKASANTSFAVTEAGATGSAASFVLSGAGTVVITDLGGSASGTISSVGDGWYRCTFSYTTNGVQTILYLNNTAISAFLWGAQLELGSTASAYQRVVSNYDVTEAGVPSCYYVLANGVNTAYVTPTITPGTDKVQGFAGVRRSDNVGYDVLIETSTSFDANNGTATIGSTAQWIFGSKGTAGTTAAFSATAPITNVITGLGDISGDMATLRVNGTQVAQSTADQGTGNYLAYPAYIYARGGTTLPFNGYDFGHAERFGPNLDAATIALVESLIARNTPEVTL